MSDVDWAAVLAIATVSLAVATFWLGWQARAQVAEARRAQDEDHAERRRAVIRGAIEEAVENCRRLLSHEPRQTSDPGKIVPRPLEFAALSDLLRLVDLPNDLVAYLIWARGHAQRLAIRYQEKATELAQVGVGRDAALFNEATGIWKQELDVLQSVACLVRACGSADPRLASVAAGPGFRLWLTAREGPPNERVLGYAALRAYWGAPDFPTSSPVFSSCSPQARDAEGAAVGEAIRAELAGLMDPRTRLPGP